VIDELIQRSDVGDVLERALSGERLSVKDGVRLFGSRDIHAIGACAHRVRLQLHGLRTHYIVNRHINYTNICKNRCKFCAFSRELGDETAYTLDINDIVKRAEQEYKTIRFTELHIVGGCHPSLKLDYYVDLLRALKERFPNVHLQAFTAVEIAHIADVSGLSIEEVLHILRSAGLGSLPGGGAEVFCNSVRDVLCPEKLSASKWLGVMRVAHELGIRSNATMLFGHIESPEDRAEHIVALRDLQDSTGGFLSFIPLKFHPSNTRLAHLARGVDVIDDLKVYAVSRLMLDNVPHIKAFWIMLGLKLAQVALNYGADDIDGTVVEEHITHSAGATTPEGLTVTQLIGLVEGAGFVPVERDTLYNEVIRNEAGVPAIS